MPPKKTNVQKKVSKTPPKKTKTPPKEKHVEKQVVEKPVVEKPVVEKPVVEKPAVEKPVADTDSEMAERKAVMKEFQTLSANLEATLQMVRQMKSQMRELEKCIVRDQKCSDKKMRNKRKTRVVDPNAEPSGFAKPGPVSDELCKFLGLKVGTHIARTEVTKEINKYCKENNLQKPEDKRTILPNKDLKTLLRLKKGDEVTFFNLQKYMKVHFPNKDGVFPESA